MKAVKLKDCKWEVRTFKEYDWTVYASTKDSAGMKCDFFKQEFNTKSEALNGWKAFAKLNGYKKYKIIKG